MNKRLFTFGCSFTKWSWPTWNDYIGLSFDEYYNFACGGADNKNMLITFTGFKNNNSLSKLGNINIWVNSKNYDIIENTHQFWLLLLVDSLDKFKKDL